MAQASAPGAVIYLEKDPWDLVVRQSSYQRSAASLLLIDLVVRTCFVQPCSAVRQELVALSRELSACHPGSSSLDRLVWEVAREMTPLTVVVDIWDLQKETFLQAVGLLFVSLGVGRDLEQEVCPLSDASYTLHLRMATDCQVMLSIVVKVYPLVELQVVDPQQRMEVLLQLRHDMQLLQRRSLQD